MSTPAQESQGVLRADPSRVVTPAKSTCGRCLKPITLLAKGGWFDGNDFWCEGTGYQHDAPPVWVEENIRRLREERDKALANKWPCGDRPNPCVGHSGDGVNVYGDKESMKKVCDALWYEPQLREHLKAERDNLLKAIEERDMWKERAKEYRSWD
jgi:hypothetical protein